MKICPVCKDGIMPDDRFQFPYAGQTFCTRTCAEIFCSNHTEHQCSFCAEPLCNADADEIIASGNQMFCCKEHKTKYMKAAQDVDAFDRVNDR